MSVLDKMVRAAAREGKRQVQLAKQAAEHTALDEWVLRDLKDEAPQFAERLAQPIEFEDGSSYAGASELHDDIFLAAHTIGDGKAKRPEDMRPSHMPGRNVLDRFVKTEEFRDAKVYTEHDQNTAAIFSAASTKVIDELMRDDALREQREQAEQLAEQEARLERLKERLAEERQHAQLAQQASGEIPVEIADNVKALTEQREQAAQDLAKAAKKIPTDVPASMDAAIAQAAEEAGERVEVWGQVAGTAQEQFGRVRPDEAIALVEAWMQVPDYREFCKLLGRIQRDFRSQDARNVIGGDDEIVGIEQGADLTRVLPSELGLLGNGTTAKLFYRALIDETLLQFETQGSEKVNLGPGVLLIDLSSSMSSPSAGVPKHTQAKAVAVGFVRLMHKKRRDAVVICFNGAVMWEHHFERGRSLEMQTLLDLASLVPSGGTTGITQACQHAQRWCDHSAPFKKADVLVVTDGQVPYVPAAEVVRVHMEKIGVRRKGIAIAHTPAPGGWLLSFCEDAIGVTDLTEATGDIVRAVA